MRRSLKFAISILWLCPVAAMATPILDVDRNGRLIGASNIDVNGVMYDVEFTEGDCFDVFDNCSEDAFTFTTQTDALAASAALLAQVFTDTAVNGQGNFDSLPQLTLGCTSTLLCSALTPYQLGFGVRFAIADNHAAENLDGLSTAESAFSLDRDDTVWVVWTAAPTIVPEPTTISLLLIGFAALAWRQRAQRGRTTANL